MGILFLAVGAVLLALSLYQVERMMKMNAAVERLAREVQELTTVNESAIALIEGLAQEIRDAAGDEARLNELADSLDAQTTRLADAVDANTEAPEEPPVEEQPIV